MYRLPFLHSLAAHVGLVGAVALSSGWWEPPQSPGGEGADAAGAWVGRELRHHGVLDRAAS